MPAWVVHLPHNRVWVWVYGCGAVCHIVLWMTHIPTAWNHCWVAFIAYHLWPGSTKPKKKALVMFHLGDYISQNSSTPCDKGHSGTYTPKRPFLKAMMWGVHVWNPQHNTFSTIAPCDMISYDGSFFSQVLLTACLALRINWTSRQLKATETTIFHPNWSMSYTRRAAILGRMLVQVSIKPWKLLSDLGLVSLFSFLSLTYLMGSSGESESHVYCTELSLKKAETEHNKHNW